MEKGISVVVCCYNSAAVIGPTIGALAGQSVPAGSGYEVILVDNACTDNTVALARAAWGETPYFLRVVTELKPGLVYARETGVKAARYDIFLFIDDDNILDGDWLPRLEQIYRDMPQVGAVVGYNEALIAGPKPDWFYRFQETYACGPRARGMGLNPEKLFGAGTSFRTHVLREAMFSGLPLFLVGRTKNTLTRGEDTEIALRCRLLGWDFYYDETLRIKHRLLPGRLTWEYICRAKKAGGQAALILDIYQDLLDGKEPGGFFDLVRQVREKWREYRHNKKEHPFIFKQEGHPQTVKFYRLLGMTQGLWVYGRRYRRIRQAITGYFQRKDGRSAPVSAAGGGIYFSRSNPSAGTGGGGLRRTTQVALALQALKGVEIATVYGADMVKETRGKAGSTRGFRLFGYLADWWGCRWWHAERLQAVRRLTGASRDWAGDEDRLSHLKLAVVEDPIYFAPLVGKLARRRIPLIASCQNIESLSYPKISFRNKARLFRREIDILRLCDLVITISREDTWLLKNFNIDAFFFPYYPDGGVYERLIKIRRARKTSGKEGIMLLGNAGNMATRRGMTQVMNNWKRQGLAGSFGKLLVAGYKTDVFFDKYPTDNDIEFLGPLPDDRLDERLISIRAGLCHQEGGGGALIKIADMLVAGVPVLASSPTARSYYGRPGLIEFPGLLNLKNALVQLDQLPEHIPVPPAPDPAVLVAKIESLIQKRKLS